MAQPEQSPTNRVPTPVPTPPPPPRGGYPVRRPGVIAAVPSAPQTRPGDQNALCIETDQA